MGGYVIQKYLEHHPAPGAVLLASIPPQGALPMCARYFKRHPLPVLKNVVRLSVYDMMIGTPELSKQAFFSPDFPDDQAYAYHTRLQDESFRVALDAGLLALPRPERIKTPMLVLGAGRDTIINAEEIEATARAYGTQAEIFPDLAHDMMLERGWQRVADRIIAWLRDQRL
jgi:alpha-beta hydrolase superfamily lysophospholipase